jgi:hypothetical protein
MKRIVRVFPWQGFLLGLSSLLLVGIVEKEALISYLVVVGLTAMMIRQGWVRRRRGKDGTAGQL